MSDPKRWLEDAPRDDLRATLEALSTMEPAADAKERVWAKLAVSLPGTGEGGSSSSGSAAGAPSGGSSIGAASALGAARLGAALLFATAIGAGAFVWMTREPPRADVARGAANVLASAPA